MSHHIQKINTNLFYQMQNPKAVEARFAMLISRSFNSENLNNINIEVVDGAALEQDFSSHKVGNVNFEVSTNATIWHVLNRENTNLRDFSVLDNLSGNLEDVEILSKYFECLEYLSENRGSRNKDSKKMITRFPLKRCKEQLFWDQRPDDQLLFRLITMFNETFDVIMLDESSLKLLPEVMPKFIELLREAGIKVERSMNDFS